MRSFFTRLLPPRPLVLPAIVSGVLVTLCFPVVSIDWLAFVALVPLIAAFQITRPGRRDGFKAGFLFGMVCHLTMLWWIVKLIPSADVSIPWLMTLSLVLLVLYLSLYPAFFLLVTSTTARYRWPALVLTAPAVWTLLEMVRARGELAFPWGALGYALSDTPPMIQLAAVGGLPLLTFLIVLVNVLLSGLFVLRNTAARVASPVVAGVIIALVWWHGSTSIRDFDAGDATPVRVAVVQPNVDLAVKWKREFRDSTFKLIGRLAREAARQQADLMIFPETSAPVYMEEKAFARLFGD